MALGRKRKSEYMEQSTMLNIILQPKNVKTITRTNKNIKKEKIEIINLDDLIRLADTYDRRTNKFYNLVDLEKLNSIHKELIELNDLIGLDQVKNDLINQILYFCSKKDIDCEEYMYHTCITGPPGVGKTVFAQILARIYKNLKIIPNDTIRIAKRTDFISRYLGHTAKKTQRIIDECKGGVLFIDEAYSLGNKGDDDTYSKECIDILTQNLSERRDFICIIAGYKEAIEECFFRVNDGLKRRFSFYFNIEPYTSTELSLIFLKKLEKQNLNIISSDKQKIIKLIEQNYNMFKNNAGDMETLSLYCKIAKFRDINNSEIDIIYYDNIIAGLHNFISG